MPTSTEQSSQKLFETITALMVALQAAEAHPQFERGAEIEALRAEIAELSKTLPSAWPGVPPAAAGAARAWPVEPEQQRALQKKLGALRDRLIELVAADGPSQPAHHIMRKAYASTFEIVLLVVLGLVGTIATLRCVIELWPSATPQPDVPSEVLAETGGRPTGSAAPGAPSASAVDSASSGTPQREHVAPPSNDAAVGQDEDAGGVSMGAEDVVPDGGPADAGTKVGGSAEAGAAAVSSASTSEAETAPTPRAAKADAAPEETELRRAITTLEAATKELAKKSRPVPERNVLTMIVLLGALGGFVHLTSSLAKYVGTRRLLRSWIVYYLLMPVSGAGLAPMIYLLLRVGVLGNGSGEMNVFGLYAFAALTGLFAEQALEKLADVFSRIFAKPSDKDGLGAAETGKKGT